jgi:amino acid adenylation domain-containing protein
MTATHSGEQPSALKRALAAIQDLTARLEEERSARREPIAIIGMACRLPGGANTPDGFWDVLSTGRDVISEPPEGRFDPAIPASGLRGGYLNVPVDEFDAAFFSIAPRDAEQMDPQHRMLLELAWEALEDAAVPALSISGTRTGVYIGVSTGDYQQRQLTIRQSGSVGNPAATGGAPSVAAGRISHFLGLHGPCLALDTACSSSLVSIALAVQALRDRHADAALAGGVNLMLFSELTRALGAAGALAPDGRCRTFDAAASGYGRAEGAGIVMLKRLRDAVADGDRIHAVIRGSAINHDGRSSGVTVPNPAAQQALIRAALDDAALGPERVDFVEAQGTGSSLGDPLELRALEAVFGDGRPAGRPLLVGTGKTVIGHCEAAAGVASLLKVVLSLRHESIPAHLHFSTPTPHVPWEDLHLKVPAQAVPWRADVLPRVAGVSAFGLGGTNAHLIVEEAPAGPPAGPPQFNAHLLTCSARDGAALRTLAAAYATALRERPDDVANICFTAALGRTHFDTRLAVMGSSAEELAAALLRAAAEAPEEQSPQNLRRTVRIGFMLSDDAIPSAATLSAIVAASAAALEEMTAACAVADPMLPHPLLPLLLNDQEDRATRLEQPEYQAAAAFVVHATFAAHWRSWGIDAAAVAGTGSSEVAAAYVSGALTLRDGMRFVIERARARALPADDRRRTMAALIAGLDTLRSHTPLVAGSAGGLAASTTRALDASIRSRETVEAPSVHDTLRALQRAELTAVIELGVCAHHEMAEARNALPLTDTAWLLSAGSDDAAVRGSLESLAALYRCGAMPRWESVFDSAMHRKVSLPFYPFQRKRYWYTEQPDYAEQPDADVLAVGSLRRLRSPAFTPAEAGAVRGDSLADYLRVQLARALGLQPGTPLTADQRLADLGLSSLGVIELRNSLLHDLGIDVPARDFFVAASVRDLVTRIEARREDDPVPGVALIPVDRATALPLSFSQERLWLLQRLDPSTCAYNIISAHRLHGPLREPALRAALTALLARHESLRTRFVHSDGEPRQFIDPAAAAPLELLDVSTYAPAEREAEWQRHAAERASRPFDLSSGAPFRAMLFRCATDEHVLVLCMHHAVTDGWSMRVLERDLAALYRAEASGNAAELPPLRVQYADYATWQREWMRGSTAQAQLAYWRRQLEGIPLLELPADRPRPPVQTHRSGMLVHPLPGGLTERLRLLAAGEEATHFTVLLAAFTVLLGRLAGQTDVVVGSPVAGRPRAEVEPLIGCFINNLVLRTDLSGNPSFAELLARVRAMMLDALANQDVPFESVIDELQPARDASRSPLFQVLFNMLPPRTAERADWGTLRGAALPPPAMENDAKFDMTLYVVEEEELRLALLYNRDLFDERRMVTLLEQFEQVLAEAVANPRRPLEELSLVTSTVSSSLPDPRQPLHATAASTIQELVRPAVVRAPDAVAIVDGPVAWSYAELWEVSGRLASFLRAEGVSAGDSVTIYAQRTGTLVPAILGVLRAGARFAILDPAQPHERLRQCIRALRPRAMLVLEAAGVVPSMLRTEVGAEVPWLELPLRPGDVLASIPESPAGELPDVAPDADAYIAFTSGTTGAPRGIVGRHAPVAHFIGWHCRTFGLGSTDRFVMLSGLGHDPLLRDIFTPLSLGATLCVPSPDSMRDATELLSTLATHAVTVAHLTPAMGLLLSCGTGHSTSPLPTLRWAFFGGDVLTLGNVRALERLAPSVRCVNFYGATETPQAIAWCLAPQTPAEQDELSHRQQVPLGEGIEGVQLLVLTPSGRQCGVGELGEVYVRTPHLASGYLDDPAHTSARFVANPFGSSPDDLLYRTGDLGRYLPDGRVAFAGRTDDQVKIRGVRVEPSEVEVVLSGHAQVRRAVVLTMNGAGERRLAAFVEQRPMSLVPLEPAELRAFLHGRLPAHLVPATITLIDQVPLTASGKVDRASLKLVERSDDNAPHPGQMTAVEAVIARMWGELLEMPQPSLRDNFFDLGGHSLLAARFIALFERETGVRLDPRELTYQTLGQIAAAHPDAAPRANVPPPPVAGILTRLRASLLARGGRLGIGR